MIDNENFKSLYTKVESNISNALVDMQEIKLKSSVGNEHIESLKKKLGEIQNQFKEEITYLGKHSEWEKFTIAFFGETNAGKSTIIESLRILFQEKSRTQMVEENRSDLDEMEKNYQKEIESMVASLSETYFQYEQGVSQIADEIAALSKVSKHEVESNKFVLVEMEKGYQKKMTGMLENHKFALVEMEINYQKKIENMAASHNETQIHHDQEVSQLTCEFASLSKISKYEQRISKKIILVALTLTLGFGTGFLANRLSGSANTVAHHSADALASSVLQPS